MRRVLPAILLLLGFVAFLSTSTSSAYASGRWFGVYMPGVPASVSSLSSIQTVRTGHADVLNFFVNDSTAFPQSQCANAAANGSVPMITLEMWSTQGHGVSVINNGSRDAYLRTFARAAKAYGGTVWLRPLHEMNGNWYPWAGAAAGNSPAKVVAAFRRIKGIFDAQGATNVRFVWCVNSDSVPNSSTNSIAHYWPGNNYVNYVALDGYNWGSGHTGGWRSFSSVFSKAYSTVTALTPRSVFIAETASSESGGSKAAWITDMFRQITARFTAIRGVVWFDANKELDWRLNSSAASWNAYQTAVPLF